MHTESISPPIFNGVRIMNRPAPENVMRIDVGAMPMISDMERNGMKISPERVYKLRDKLVDRMDSLAAKVEQISGYRINIGSDPQLADLLYFKLGLKQPREKYTPSKERLSTDGDILKAMVKNDSTGVVRTVLDWKEAKKLLSTYTLSLLAKADEGSRIHTRISSTTTGTGRLASSDPNLQNIPIRSKLGREVRGCFVPEPGMCLGTVDASQIEMRMNAHDSQCAGLMDIFNRKEDVYWGTAEIMYKRRFDGSIRECDCGKLDKSVVLPSGGFLVLPNGHTEGCPTVIDAPGQVYHGQTYKKWFRGNAKITALMVGYDASAAGLNDQFQAWGVEGFTEESCEQAIKDYFSYPDGFHELLSRKATHSRRAIRYGLVWEVGGRIRPTPEVYSKVRYKVNEGFRQAGNMAGQGGASFVIKLWMAIMWAEAKYWKRHGLKFLMQIHDELIVEGPKQVVTDWLNEAADTLRGLFSEVQRWFNVPLDGSFVIGDVDESWASLEK